MYQIVIPQNLKFTVYVLFFLLSSTAATAQVCNLNCNAHVNISLDEDCQRVIVIDDVLENPNCTTLAPVSYTHLDVYKRQAPGYRRT